MAKYAADAADIYADPETGVLHNLLGIKDQPTLEKVESTLSFLRAQELEESPLSGRFDLNRLQAIHKRLFGDIYEWAGELRRVDIEKGSTRFAHHGMIESAAAGLFGQLERENNLVGLSPAEFSKRAGHYLGEINVLHPFREGNGRTQREFIGQLAHQAGHQISWAGLSREEMIEASIEAYASAPAKLASLIRANLREPGAELAGERSLSAARDFAQAQRLEIQSTNTEHGRYTGTVVHETDLHFVQAIADNAVAIHAKRGLSAASISALGIGTQARVQYNNGQAKISRVGPDRGRGKSR